MMNIIKQYLFWRKWRKDVALGKFIGVPMSIEMYCIAPNSFKTTRENLEQMKVLK